MQYISTKAAETTMCKRVGAVGVAPGSVELMACRVGVGRW